MKKQAQFIKKSIYLVSLFFLISVIISSCTKKSNELDGTHWVMTDWTLDIPKPAKNSLTLFFDDNKIEGTIGINAFTAIYKIATKESLTFQNVSVTHDEDANITPFTINKIMNAFRDTAFFKNEKDELVFYDKFGSEILIFHADK